MREVSPVMVQILTKLEVRGQLGGEAGQGSQAVMEASVKLGLLVKEMQRPQNGRDVGEQRGRAIYLCSCHGGGGQV